MTIKDYQVNNFCADKPCEAEIHMSKDCSGEVIGIASISADGGITRIDPKQNKDGYVLRKIDNMHAVIEGGPSKGLWGFLFG